MTRSQFASGVALPPQGRRIGLFSKPSGALTGVIRFGDDSRSPARNTRPHATAGWICKRATLCCEKSPDVRDNRTVVRMTGPDELLAVIEAIYAAGLEAKLWPQALA